MSSEQSQSGLQAGLQSGFKGLRGDYREQVATGAYNTWRSGGPARRFYRPEDRQDLQHFLSQLDPSEPLLWLGLGSNLLVRDGGFPGTVIFTLGALKDIRQLDATRFEVAAGVPCNKVARQTAKAGLVGTEFLVGIPGTMGGALAMNAGAWGGETWPLVERVTLINRRGELIEREPQDYQIGYRSVSPTQGGGEEEWFVSATLNLKQGDTQAASERIRVLLEKRAASQPTGQPSCGSVFRNPHGDHSARLIEACGLKGHCIGKACVSEKHANFIINTGGASATDIEALLLMVQARVRDEQGVELMPEVRIVGEHLSGEALSGEYLGGEYLGGEARGEGEA